jgi:hypothetical protein
MAEFLGYVNPANVKANPTLDWGSVITDVQDTIIQQEQQRQAARDKQSKENADLNKELNKISLSRSQDVNGFLTNSVYKAKEINNDAYKLYTSGKINGKQYNIIKQNISTGFSEFDALGKSVAKIQEEYAKLSEEGKTSFLADYNMGQLGNSLDLKNKIPYVDPATGLMYVAPMDANGKADMSKLDSPRWMLSQADMPLKFDYLAEADKRSKDIGKYEYILKNPPAGGIWTIDNIQSKPEFKKFLDETAASIASNPTKQASILGDRAGSSYTLTSDPNAKDKDSIVVKKDLSTGVNTPVLTEEQVKESENIVKNAILAKINQTLKQQEGTWHGFAPSSGGGKPKDMSKVPFIGEPSYINTKDRTIGKVVPVSGVTIKRAPGVVEQVNRVGISNGKLFVTYTKYNGTSGYEDFDSGNRASYKNKETVTVYEDKDRNNINERLRFVGGGFEDIESAKQTLGFTPSKGKSTASTENLRSKYNY